MIKIDKTLICIFGPTASGKTSLAIQLAKKLNTEIVSADSRQIYSELSIGTAKPSVKELNEVKHHLVGHKSIHDKYNAGIYFREAREILKSIFKHKDVAILCGGTGLYIDAVLNGLNDLPEVNNSLREELNVLHNTSGLDALVERLNSIDINAKNLIEINNPARLKRAIEIVETSGKSLAENWTRTKDPLPYKVIKIGLMPNRDELYNIINSRVDNMMDQGLLEENKCNINNQHLNALNTVGYKEFIPFFKNERSLEESINKLKQNTRNYAKRQMTWLRNNKDYIIFEEYENDEVLTRILHLA